jgi:hypothetical protein
MEKALYKNRHLSRCFSLLNMTGKSSTTSLENHDHRSYAGACSQIKPDSFLLLGPDNRYSQIPTLRLFLGKYLTYPSTMECATDDDSLYYHVPTILTYLQEQLHHQIDSDCVTRKYNRKIKRNYVASRVCDLGNGIMIEFDGSYMDSDVQNPNKLKADHADNYFLIMSDIKIYYLPQHDAYIENLASHFKEMTVFSSKSCTLQMVCRNQCGYYLSAIKIKKPLITDLALHYGPKFVSIHDKILKNLNTKESKGIVLLHGIPGSGRYPLASVLRYLAYILSCR